MVENVAMVASRASGQPEYKERSCFIFTRNKKMSQKEDSQKAVLTEIQNQTIIVSSQGEVKSQLEAQSEDRVSSQVRDSQASSCAASQGQVLSQAQLASQHSVSSQATVASQGQPRTQASQHVSSQDSVETQAQAWSRYGLPSQPTDADIRMAMGAYHIMQDVLRIAQERGIRDEPYENSQDAQRKNNE